MDVVVHGVLEMGYVDESPRPGLVARINLEST